ncbi:fasciclin domain-containing protein [Croceiramulus getboli]|nr:fasciclin domain-containing protein [Flavobacteriaceae bacterium YJPT1-3]
MKNLFYLSRLFLVAVLLVGFTSCSDDDDGDVQMTENTIADFVADNPNYSSLLAALQQTGLDATLDGAGSFTVFAPDNAAFDAYLGGTALADVDNDVLTQLLLNHVIGQELPASAISTGYIKTSAQESSTAANIDMYIDTTSGITINGEVDVDVANANIETDNGIIHPVNAVIEIPTIVTFATTNPALSSLVAALTDEGNTTFVGLLSDTNADFTVFAPTNAAFDTFLDGATLDDIDNAALAQVLSNHVVPGAVALSTGLSNSYVNTAATFDGNADEPISLYINTDQDVTLNGYSDVVQADIVAGNGVVHVVNAVIDLPDVTTFVVADPNFNILLDALTREPDFTYVATLQASGTPAPFTVFAPNNEAFAALLTDLQLESLADVPAATLAATLELHVITEANVRSEDLPALNDTQVTTLNGADITIDANTPGVLDPDGGLNEIIVTDVQAANGVIHVVSRVLRDLN